MYVKIKFLQKPVESRFEIYLSFSIKVFNYVMSKIDYRVYQSTVIIK